MTVKLADRLDRHLGDGAGPSAAIRLTMAQEVCQFLSAVWDQAGIPGAAMGLVGSFAVAEGGPRSDLDVVILLPSPVDQALVEPIIRLLWDGGLGVDHSVRTARETAAVSREDLAALTGLLGLKHVAGDAALTESAALLVKNEFRSRARKRVEELLDDAARRWKQYDRLDCLNEPDLKNSMGGLRDVALLRALSTAWLADYPHQPIGEAVARILDARDALHRATGRHVSGLLRGTQPEVARLLGYPSETQMMRQLQAAGAVVAEASRTALETASQAQHAWGTSALARRILRPRAPRGPRLVPSDAQLIGQGLLVTHSQVGFADPGLAADVDRVLELAAYGAETKTPISRSTLADIAQTDVPFSWTEHRLDAFLRLLGAGTGLRETWAALESINLIARWFPEWEPLRGRPQAAAFHKWTVDRHLIETVIHLQAILEGTEPGVSLRLDVRSIPGRAALLAALFHDLGKQPPNGGPDHPAHGRRLAEPLLNRLPLSPDEKHLILLLIENHLLLAQSAIDADPGDPRNIANLLDRCGHSESVLHSLAALTCADSLGAGPRAWTPWRESLIGSFVEAARAEIRRR